MQGDEQLQNRKAGETWAFVDMTGVTEWADRVAATWVKDVDKQREEKGATGEK